ncbi:MAG: hypothetical protein M0004_04475 [Actinomycetota bacterium]|nr:hypothetical protein [Actinomycetota bacterium]
MLVAQLGDWEHGAIARLTEAHDIDRGTVVVSARVGGRTMSYALRDLLSALDRDPPPVGRYSEAELWQLASAWLVGEDTQLVVVLSAQRWHPSVVEAFATRFASEVPLLALVFTEGAGDSVCKARGTGVVERVSPSGLVELAELQHTTRPAAGPFAQVRRSFLPHMVITGVADHLGWDIGEVGAALADSYDATGILHCPGGDIAVPAPLQRFFAAQSRWAHLAGAKHFASRRGERLHASSFAFAHMKLEGWRCLPRAPDCSLQQLIVGEPDQRTQLQVQGAESVGRL